MKPRLKLHYRTAIQADADTVNLKAGAILNGLKEYDRPQKLQTFFDAELKDWVVYADVRYTDQATRDSVVTQLNALMTTDLATSPVTKSTSYVSAHLSHHDEGVGGAFDTPSLVTNTKAALLGL